MRELILLFQKRAVEFLVVGAHAVSCYVEPRATKDLDIFINPTPGNAKKVFESLSEFGAPTASVTEADFCDPETFFIIGVKPNRVDILKKIPGMEFAGAWSQRKMITVDDIELPIPCLEDLLSAKLASGRPQDLLDAEKLRRAKKLINS